jgi:epoxyqueuosine reductase
VIEKRLIKLARYVAAEGGEGTETRVYVDTGPLLEKAFAQQAGVGFFGKNTNIITRHQGSWVFLASLLTNLELERDLPHAGSCGSCTLCLDACPTQALTGPYQIDARRCIAYLSIETKVEVPDDLREKMGDWVFGCDVCQDVCPYNSRAKLTRHPELAEKRAGTWVDLVDFRRPEGSPLKRAKHPALKKPVI